MQGRDESDGSGEGLFLLLPHWRDKLFCRSLVEPKTKPKQTELSRRVFCGLTAGLIDVGENPKVGFSKHAVRMRLARTMDETQTYMRW